MPLTDRDLYDMDESGVCRKCYGDGIVPDNRMGVITPFSETDENGNYICPRCGGTGAEP